MNKLMKPLFTVVIPLYNKRNHIARAIDSVLAQSNKDFEIVIIDDGSTDGGAELVEMDYRECLGEKGMIRIIRQNNAGVSAARNKGVAYARGEIVAFLDADDSWEVHFLDEIERMYHYYPDAGAFGTGYQFIIDGERFVDPKIRFSKPAHAPRILDDYFEVGAQGALPFTMSSFCIKKTVFNEVGEFPVGEPMGEDQDLFCRVALHSEIAYSPSVLSFYHQDSENRACNAIVPSEPCGFAQRLKSQALYEVNFSLKESLLNYVAAHVLHLVSLNVKSARTAEAAHLLEDECCKRHYTRYCWWRFRNWLTTMGKPVASS